MVKINTPEKLLLLERLCWNISNPYDLPPQDMLRIYEARWVYRDGLGTANPEELEFISYLAKEFNYPQLMPMAASKKDKHEFYDLAIDILHALNFEVINNNKAIFGGGTMLALEQERYRLSFDINFICSRDSLNSLRRWFQDNPETKLFDNERIGCKMMRCDGYGIRLSIHSNVHQPIKLEFICENRFELQSPDMSKIANLPILSVEDRFVSKLLANSDRYIDSSVHSRDLIDLAILRLAHPIPEKAFERAENNYKVREPLAEAIEYFQKHPDWREKCYEALTIDNPIRIIDGIDKLAADFDLEPTTRSFAETNFNYLDD